jgi:RNase P subunit RPR2
MTLKTLEQHNRQYEIGATKITPSNGIACPKCDKELVDTNPNEVLLSYPAQMRVACLACGWTGTRCA